LCVKSVAALNTLIAMHPYVKTEGSVALAPWGSVYQIIVLLASF
jgi:hypothetical protein